MAERQFNQFQYTYEKDSVTLFGSATIINDIGTPSYNGQPRPGGGIENIVSDYVSPTFATFAGQVPGMTSPVVIQADNAGTAGNSIVLTGDGSTDIADLLTAWNVANPSNTATTQAGDDTQIPNNGETLQLSGGIDEANLGLYTVTLSDVFNKLMLIDIEIVYVDLSVVYKFQPLASNSSLQTDIQTGSSFQLQALDYARAPVIPENGSEILMRFVCRNSSVNAPNG